MELHTILGFGGRIPASMYDHQNSPPQSGFGLDWTRFRGLLMNWCAFLTRSQTALSVIFAGTERPGLPSSFFNMSASVHSGECPRDSPQHYVPSVVLFDF
jgi:hypothetical protein